MTINASELPGKGDRGDNLLRQRDPQARTEWLPSSARPGYPAPRARGDSLRTGGILQVSLQELPRVQTFWPFSDI